MGEKRLDRRRIKDGIQGTVERGGVELTGRKRGRKGARKYASGKLINGVKIRLTLIGIVVKQK